ncbi:MAG: hypothetical protein IE928_11145, partial [Gammaproteobacteria bacterium]|nr:hypothetical protein [Gammaproteobacteria bacterium]
NNFDPITIETLSFIEQVSDFNGYLDDPSNLLDFKDIIASSAAMTAIAESSTAMSAVAASSTAMSAIAASSTAMSAIDANDQAVRIWMLAGTGQNYANFASVTAVAASSTAMSAIAASSTAMNAVNASQTAMDAIYASALVTKVNYGLAATWASEVTIRSGAGLFVRLTTFGNGGGWGEGNTGSEWIEYDGADVYYSERGANPYNHTALTASPRHPMRKFNSSLKYRGYAAVEIAYIQL